MSYDYNRDMGRFALKSRQKITKLNKNIRPDSGSMVIHHTFESRFWIPESGFLFSS